MNPIDKFLLWFFLLPASLYEKAGVNTLQLKAILSAKLTMDNRRVPGFGRQNRSREKKEMNQATLGGMFIGLLMGLFMLYSFSIGIDMITKLTFFMSMFIVMLCITLITDFTSVLIDVRDNFIILPKPITDATFLASRLLHITIRTCILVIPLSLPAFIFTTFKEGPAILLPFILIILMSTLFSIFLINAVYILILKITTPSKFQSIINYIQIAFAVFLFAGYQLMPRLMNNSALAHTSLADLFYIRFYPPFWFADGCLVLTKLDFSSMGNIISLGLSLLLPIVSIWLVVRVFAPSFNRKLSMITAGTVEESTAKVKSGKRRKVSLAEHIGSLLAKPGSEYMGFLFSWKMMGRSRDFKMKVYPAFGYIIVFIILLFFQTPFNKGVPSENAQIMLPKFLGVIYLSSFVLISALNQLPYSEKFRASWIFHITPVEAPGKVISGALKSVMVLFYIPIAILVLVFGLVLMGPGVLPNLLLGCFNILATGSVIGLIMVRKLPFSSMLEGSSKGGGFIKSMLTLLIPVFFGVIHWAISGYLWIVILFLVLSLAVSWLVFNEIKKLDWNKVS
jgi:hypothetical protein